MKLSGEWMPNEMSVSTGPYVLSKARLNFYWDNGFLIIRKLFDLPTLNLFRNRFVEICNKCDASQIYSVVTEQSLYNKDLEPEMYINKIQELLFDPVFMKYSEDPQMLHIISQLIGDDITAVNCMMINKPPGSGDHPTHQDLYYFPFRPEHKIVAAWTAVDTVCPNNGCLYVIPTSHKAEILYDHCDRDSDNKLFYYGIRDENAVAPVDRRVYLQMQPGDTVFFHPCLVHGSGPNVSKGYRKAMSAHFASSSCRYIDLKGTNQECIGTQIEEELKRRGSQLDLVGYWRIKSKQVKGARCHL